MPKVRRKQLIPEGTPIDVLIADAQEVMGQFGPQYELDLDVINGEFKGYPFKDWLKLHRDEETGETYIKEGGKCWEVLAAVFGETGAEEFEDVSELVGEKLTARASLRGKAKKNNGLEFGSIGPYIAPKKRKANQKKAEEAIASDLEEAELSAEDEEDMKKGLDV